MPELPEVETVARGLRDYILNQTIQGLEILNSKSFLTDNPSDVPEHLIGQKLSGIERRGKMLIIRLGNGYDLAIHLKMTGQLVWRGSNHTSANRNGAEHKSDDAGESVSAGKSVSAVASPSASPSEWAAGHPTSSFTATLPDNSTRLIFEFATGKLFFNDQRIFGWVRLIPHKMVAEMPFVKKLGPEPFPVREELKGQFVSNMRRHQKTNIKAALLNQENLAGIGNIYADEALWAAMVHPSTKVGQLSEQKLLELLQAAQDVMQKSLDSGGSTMATYVKADGSRGNYLDLFANVFRRGGQPCPRCGAVIAKTKVAGRGTHYCPKCQRIK